MAGIRETIELYDSFSTPLLHIINSVQLAVSSMQEMSETMNRPFDMAGLDGARAEIDRATASVRLLQEQMQRAANTRQNANNNGPLMAQWRSPNNPQVFTNTGIERYRQEIASANQMLTRLTESQRRISVMSGQTRILPPNAMSDLRTMDNRIHQIAERIRQVEANPIDNIGADRVNNQLETLRGQLSRALQAQNDLTSAMQRMDVSAANDAYRRLNEVVDGTERHIRDNVEEQEQFNNEIRQGQSAFDGLKGKIMAAAAAYLSLRGVGQAINLSDVMAGNKARLELLVDDGGSVQQLQNKIFQSAQSARSDYMAVSQTVSKMGLLAGKAFADNDEIIAFTEQINKNFIIGGSSISEQTSAMYQLTQAMAAGKLQGDEYRSIIENAPLLANAIEDYMTNAGVEGTMKEWASEGMLTAEVIKKALFSVADETNARFEKMPLTFGQVFTSFKNEAIDSFQPILDRMNEVANSEQFNTLVTGMINTLTVVSGIVVEIFDAIAQVAQFAGDNWNWIAPTIAGIVGALGAWKLETGAVTLATQILDSTLWSNPLFWIAMAIGVVIAAIARWVSAVGGLRVAWLIVTNHILYLIDIIKMSFTLCVNFVLDNWERMRLGMAAAGVGIANAMDTMKTNVLIAIETMVNGAIDLINQLINAANAVLDTGIEVIQKVTFGAEAAVASEASKRARAAALVDQQNETEKAIKERENNLNKMKEDTINALKERLREIAEARADAAAGTGTDGGGHAINPGDYIGNAGGAGDIGSNVGDIADNTGAIADAMEITTEELKYLRDIAEREAINRYTTAEVNIDMSGMKNTLNNNSDVDGFINQITFAINETIKSNAQGVHA